MASLQIALKFLIYTLIIAIISLNLSCSDKQQASSEITTPELKCTLFVDRVGDYYQARLSFEISDSWHIYGPNPQKNGRPTKVEFSSTGLQFARPDWPVTKTFIDGNSGPSEGFDGKFDVISKIENYNEVKPSVRAELSWVACKDICVPGEAILISSP